MKKLLLSCAFILVWIQFCQAQSWTWIKSTGTTDQDIVKHVSIDSAGNSYAIGVFQQTIFSGVDQLTSYGGDDFFIAKYNPQGVLQWTKSGGGIADDGYTMVCATDLVGNTVVALAAVGNVQFGTTNLNNTLSDFVLLKYDKDGNLIFAKNYGSNSNDVAMGIALDQFGNIYATGFFANTISFGTISLNSYGLTDSYLAKFDNNGLPIWAINSGGSSYDAGTGIAVDKYNHVFHTGYFSASANFSGITLTSSGGDDVFISCYDSNGNILWVKSGNGTGAYDIGNKLDCDEDGNVYTIGQFQSSISFDLLSLNSMGLSDIFIAKFDSSGNFKWARPYGGKGDDVGYDIDVLENGTMYYSGLFSDTCAFGATTLVSRGGTDIFMASNFENGSTFWLKQNGGLGDDIGRSIKVRNETDCFIGGSFSDLVAFDNFNMQSNGNLDFFVGRIAAPLSTVIDIDLQESFDVYPNPVSSGQEITINFKNEQVKTIKFELLDCLGSVIADDKYSLSNSSLSWVMPYVANGIYFIRLIRSDGKMIASRISIQN